MATATVDMSVLTGGFHALSDPTRIEILELLRGGERCQCELSDALDAAQSRLSFHLKVLREAGFITDRKDGRWVYYTLNVEALSEMGTFLSRLQTRAARLPIRSACCE